MLKPKEEDLLRNGLYFCIPPLKLWETDIFHSYELICSFMCNNLKDLKFEDQVRSELSHLANSYYSKYKLSKNSLKQHKILGKLKTNDNVVIIKPDKGNG